MKPYSSLNRKERELIDVLTAISLVSSRMARNLALLNSDNGVFNEHRNTYYKTADRCRFN